MKHERRNISAPPDWWAAFKAQAERQDMTLSEWVGACCVVFVPEFEQLSVRVVPGRPKGE